MLSRLYDTSGLLSLYTTLLYGSCHRFEDGSFVVHYTCSIAWWYLPSVSDRSCRQGDFDGVQVPLWNRLGPAAALEVSMDLVAASTANIGYYPG